MKILSLIDIIIKCIRLNIGEDYNVYTKSSYKCYPRGPIWDWLGKATDMTIRRYTGNIILHKYQWEDFGWGGVNL